MEKKLTDIYEKDFLKKFLRNSFIVFDMMCSKLRENYGNDPFAMGTLPFFGKIRNMDNDNFVLDPLFLKEEKIKSILSEMLPSIANIKKEDVGAHVTTSVMMMMLERSDNCFSSISMAKFNKTTVEGLIEEFPEISESLNVIKQLSRDPFGAGVNESILESMKRIIRESGAYSLISINSFMYKDLIATLKIESTFNTKTETISLVTSEEDMYRSMRIGDVKKDVNSNVHDLFSQKELPLFLIDTKW